MAALPVAPPLCPPNFQTTGPALCSKYRPLRQNMLTKQKRARQTLCEGEPDLWSDAAVRMEPALGFQGLVWKRSETLCVPEPVHHNFPAESYRRDNLRMCFIFLILKVICLCHDYVRGTVGVITHLTQTNETAAPTTDDEKVRIDHRCSFMVAINERGKRSIPEPPRCRPDWAEPLSILGSESLGGSCRVPVRAAGHVSLNGSKCNYRMTKAGSRQPGNHFPWLRQKVKVWEAIGVWAHGGRNPTLQ